MTDCKITLIAKVFKKDSAGIQKATPTETAVFATEESIGQSEHFAAAQIGMRADIKITVWAFEYHGEKSVKYKGQPYEIYRTFERNDGKIELYLGEKVGK